MTGCISLPLPLYSQTTLSFPLLSSAVASLTSPSLVYIPRTHLVATRHIATGLVYFSRTWGLIMASLMLPKPIISTVLPYSFSALIQYHTT